VRVAALTLALLFIVLLGALTIADIANNGLTALDVVAVLIMALFSIAVVGALRNPPAE
jgi:hypothetical protein